MLPRGATVTFKRGQLAYFVAIADEGQITRAATKLHIAQPALSQAIMQLESELGIHLLQRHARGVTLTAAGEMFLPKARQALAAEMDAVQTAQSLAHAARDAVEVGFIGSPPTLHAPELFSAFADAHGEVRLSFHELTLPRAPTALWLEDVDVAFCHPPAAELGIRVQAFRLEPRVVVAPSSHRFAQRSEVTVAEVLNETFIRFHPSVEPVWAGFWSLDDHRGEPPPHRTADTALTSTELVACIASGRAVTTIPACQAATIVNILPDVVAVPLRDAAPAALALVWREDNHNPLVAALVAAARNSIEASSAVEQASRG
jgi:DNA-binding transcriptional LysR family regulator